MKYVVRVTTLEVVLSHTTKITCAEVSDVRASASGLSVVFTDSEVPFCPRCMHAKRLQPRLQLCPHGD